MCGGSPLFYCTLCFMFSGVIYVSDVGEITQGRIEVSTLVLPSLNRNLDSRAYFGSITCRGDSQESLCFSTLVLPSLNRNHCWGLFFPIFITCRGDYTG